MGSPSFSAVGVLALATASLVVGVGCDDRALARSREVADVAPPPAIAAAIPPGEACVAGAGEPLDVAALAARVGPAVVSVQGRRTVDLGDLEELLALPPGTHPRFLQRAIGAGVLITPDGLVLTNEHVVDGAFEIEVRLADDRIFPATVAARDRQLDVALLRLRGAGGLPAATLGSSAAVQVGDRAVAVGNPFGLGPSVTLGIVSAVAREVGHGPLPGLIQTDAAINPGNSGGPVFNAAGEVIGLATAVHAQGQGIGFAIPIDEVREALPELLATGRVARGQMGIAFQAVTANLARALGLEKAAGALITEIEPGGPAERAGIRPGDVLLELNARPIGHARELARALARSKPGEEVALRIRRGGDERRAKITLAQQEQVEPPQPAAPAAGAARGRPTIGLSASDGPDGATIDALDPQSAPARELEVGDVVMEVNGAAIRGAADLAARLRGAPAGSDLVLRVRREGSIRYLVIQAPS